MKLLRIEKIISGGQTGVDRAALDLAMETGLSCGGWCPKGRKAEDGPIDARYPLKETESAKYSVRTEKNVRESDGTLVLTGCGPPGAGTTLTIRFAQRLKKPFLVLVLSEAIDYESVKRWIEAQNIKALNIAGPRESDEPGIYSRALKFLKKLFLQDNSVHEQQSPPQQT